MGTDEGIVNTFTGTGDVYVQSLNLKTFVNAMTLFLPAGRS